MKFKTNIGAKPALLAVVGQRNAETKDKDLGFCFLLVS